MTKNYQKHQSGYSFQVTPRYGPSDLRYGAAKSIKKHAPGLPTDPQVPTPDHQNDQKLPKTSIRILISRHAKVWPQRPPLRNGKKHQKAHSRCAYSTPTAHTGPPKLTKIPKMVHLDPRPHPSSSQPTPGTCVLAFYFGDARGATLKHSQVPTPDHQNDQKLPKTKNKKQMCFLFFVFCFC